MSKDNNLHDYLSDLADAIREKKGTTEPINAQSFAEEIRTIEGGAPEGYEPFFAVDEGYFVQGESNGFKSKYTGEQIDTLLDMVNGSAWTGHADVEGLKAIGWTDEDIDFYQNHGVNWNKEDDEYHKITDDNKALYGVLTVDNIQEYKDRIVYLPKIDMSKKLYIGSLFLGCKKMIAIPYLDFSNTIRMGDTFKDCHSLVCIPYLNTSKTTHMTSLLKNCYSLVYIEGIDTNSATDTYQLFDSCYSLINVPSLELQNTTDVAYMFNLCVSLQTIGTMSLPSSGTVSYCYSLKKCFFRDIRASVDFRRSPILEKESLLYMIENEAAPEVITITLHAVAYARLSTDVDIIAALANHPLISLASA